VHKELGEFLRSRRASVSPADVGLPGGGRRRVAGLRRDELAQLAGVSVEYYVRLEQGRAPNVSDSVLDALADALMLRADERDHLRNLARPARNGRRPARPAEPREGLRLLLDAMAGVPAFVLGRRMEVLAWNRLGAAVHDFDVLHGERNMARYLFLDPAARELYVEWDRVAEETVAYLRLDAGRRPRDAKLAALVGELSIADETFRRLWARHDVREKAFGRKLYRHPVVGELDLRWEALAVTGDPDLLLVTFVADPGSATAERLALLASWTADAPGIQPTEVTDRA
jgi:transcriptional regulator with XRE-family HTH domain